VNRRYLILFKRNPSIASPEKITSPLETNPVQVQPPADYSAYDGIGTFAFTGSSSTTPTIQAQQSSSTIFSRHDLNYSPKIF